MNPAEHAPFAEAAAFRQASASLPSANPKIVLSYSRRPQFRRALVAAILLACSTSGAAQDEAPACPVGILICKPPPLDWSLCSRNDLLDFYVADLPASGDRTLADTEVKGRQTRSDDGESYVLEGDASIQQLDQLIRADRFTYARSSTQWTATGNIRYQDRDMLLSASDAQGSTVPSQATLNQVRYQLLSSRGNGRADVAVLKDSEHAELANTTFSTCPLDSPSWEFRAEHIELDQAHGVGYARDMSFRVGDVPLFWVPYASFPLDDRRKSGFLYPDIGYSSDRGFELATPYYFNLAPNYDLTLTPRLMTQRGLMLGGEFRYLTDSSRGTVELEWLPDDRESDDRRSLFHWDNATRFSDSWGATVNINHVSDDAYFEDFGRSLSTAATTLLPSSAYLRGQGAWWKASIGGDEYQVTDPTLTLGAEPYRRLPRATFDANHGILGDLEAGLRSEYVSFAKDEAIDGRRLDLFPYLAYPMQAASWFVRPQLGYRYTRYDIDRVEDSSPDRGTPIASVDAGLLFERGLSLGGGGYTQTLEPRLYYLRVPYRDQDNLPLFDTQEVPFSFGQLFRSNRFVGADRQMDANNLTLALTTRVIEDASGSERLSASIGQIRYFDEQRVQLPGRAPTDYVGSTYVGELDLRLSERWRLTLANQWNPNTDRTDLAAVGMQNRFGSNGVFNVSYRFRRNLLEQADASVLIPLNERWRLVGRWNYSLFDRQTLEAFAGVEHDSCCVAWRVLARHYVHNIERESTNALYFEVEFKGVGSIGQKAGDFLRRAILGYQ
jgi:LPS-assembly protein